MDCVYKLDLNLKKPQGIHKEHLAENTSLVLWLGWQDWNDLHKETCGQFLLSALKAFDPLCLALLPPWVSH